MRINRHLAVALGIAGGFIVLAALLVAICDGDDAPMLLALGAVSACLLPVLSQSDRGCCRRRG